MNVLLRMRPSPTQPCFFRPVYALTPGGILRGSTGDPQGIWSSVTPALRKVFTYSWLPVAICGNIGYHNDVRTVLALSQIYCILLLLGTYYVYPFLLAHQSFSIGNPNMRMAKKRKTLSHTASHIRKVEKQSRRRGLEKERIAS